METPNETRTELGNQLRASENQQEARNIFWMFLVETYPDVEGNGLFSNYFEYLDVLSDTIREMQERYKSDNFDGENPF